MGKCLFTGDEVELIPVDKEDAFSVSHPVLGEYLIEREVLSAYQAHSELKLHEKRSCIIEIARLRMSGLSAFFRMDNANPITRFTNVVGRSVEELRNSPRQRTSIENQLLQLLSAKPELASNQFNLVGISQLDRYALGLFEPEEIFYWVRALAHRYLIEFSQEADATFNQAEKDTRFIKEFSRTVSPVAGIRLSVSGWEEVLKTRNPKLSKKVFVAMAFTDNQKNRLPANTRDSIRSAIEACGFEMVVVDEVEHNDGVMDRVIASIKESRFVIADLTFQKRGVYYEAGYAKALSYEVIHSVRADDLENCHFDVKHLNLIVWTDLGDLEQRLIARIKALFG